MGVHGAGRLGHTRAAHPLVCVAWRHGRRISHARTPLRERSSSVASYDFDEPVERRSIDEASLKWGRYKRPYLHSPSDHDAPPASLKDEVLPMWVADMDFRSPPCVLEALQDRVAHGLFGYTAPSARLNRNVAVGIATTVLDCSLVSCLALVCIVLLTSCLDGRITSRGAMHGKWSLIRSFG